jgi:pSer/pThr/pTyr-binding forkhead associated (FHA) protein
MTTPSPTLQYEEPAWSGTPIGNTFFEIIKSGISLGRTAELKKSKAVIGRLPLCDIKLEHPSVSRYHAVIQFRKDGRAFLYDLKSPHGTYLNKTRIPPYQYEPLSDGDMIKVGASTRTFVFNGPSNIPTQSASSMNYERDTDVDDGWNGNNVVQSNEA